MKAAPLSPYDRWELSLVALLVWYSGGKRDEGGDVSETTDVLYQEGLPMPPEDRQEPEKHTGGLRVTLPGGGTTFAADRESAIRLREYIQQSEKDKVQAVGTLSMFLPQRVT